MTREDVPPICSLCKRVMQQRIASAQVPGQGAAMTSYWMCETCDVGQPSRPRT